MMMFYEHNLHIPVTYLKWAEQHISKVFVNNSSFNITIFFCINIYKANLVRY